MATLAIVGHGPSMKSASLGAEIDAHDEVMRLKRSSHLLKDRKNYGRKVTHVCGSFVVGLALQEDWPQCKSFYLFTDSRNEDVDQKTISLVANSFNSSRCLVSHSLCQYWSQMYRGNRIDADWDARQESKGAISDELGHKHPSCGFFSIVYALHDLAPEKITLYGFDSLTSGKFDYSVTRGEHWQQYPDHNWATESKLLPVLAMYYGYSYSYPTLTKGAL